MDVPLETFRKLQTLEQQLLSHRPLLVAYSGGVDSMFLLASAVRVLGSGASGVIADSPSLPRRALDEALSAAAGFGARVHIVETSEFSDPRYLTNAPDRCYFCKAELFARMDTMARERGYAALAYGENADDPPQLRPGSKAAGEFQVLAPLKAVGLSKAEIRTLARQFKLPAADSPAQPCLASRIPHGTRVTREAVEFVEKGEEVLRGYGFRVIRLRFLEGDPPGARIQVGPGEVPRLLEIAGDVTNSLQASGFGTVEIDESGYRGAGLL